MRTIPNNLDAMRAIVRGTIATFQTGIEGTLGACHNEGVLLGLMPCRFIEATGALIFGTFFLAGDGVALRSLSAEQIFEGLRAFLPPLTIVQVCEALRREEETREMVVGWSE